MLIIIIVIFILAIISLPFILYFFVFKKNKYSFTALYNIIDNEQVTKLFNISISNIDEITIDGEKVDICNEYTFPSNGLHSVSVLINSSEIKSLEKMFYKIEDLVSISFSSKFNFENIENMDRMFESCTKLTSIDLSNINAKKVNSMNYTFSRCSSLETINLYNFKTQKIGNMVGLFSKCSSLKSAGLSSLILIIL